MVGTRTILTRNNGVKLKTNHCVFNTIGMYIDKRVYNSTCWFYVRLGKDILRSLHLRSFKTKLTSVLVTGIPGLVRSIDIFREFMVVMLIYCFV